MPAELRLDKQRAEGPALLQGDEWNGLVFTEYDFQFATTPALRLGMT